jgi:hypothetical protein
MAWIRFPGSIVFMAYSITGIRDELLNRYIILNKPGSLMAAR